MNNYILSFLLCSTVFFNNSFANDFKCTNKNIPVCLELMQESVDIHHDLDTLHYAFQLCELNNDLGCLQLGELYRTSQNKFESDLYCIENEDNADENCFHLGNEPYVAYDVKKAVLAYQKSCALNNSDACTILSFIYKSNNNTNDSKKNAVQLAKTACDQNSGYGCYMVGNIYNSNNEINLANQYYQKACSLKYQKACNKTSIQ
ncbi:MAG: tetratricopeptide repeat protein [Succinivibrionaceae bacterium]